jgi:hypothetical protein
MHRDISILGWNPNAKKVCGIVAEKVAEESTFMQLILP